MGESEDFLSSEAGEVRLQKGREMTPKNIHCCFLLVLAVTVPLAGGGTSAEASVTGGGGPNYADALSKCLLFFEGQRSGKLPSDQRMTWRKDSALEDGHYLGVDLSGGYYDAGDNVKFNFPMAFTTTVLAWSIIEFGSEMGEELGHAMGAVRWATDYLLKATAERNKVYVQVGDPYADHSCWERPEDMDTSRTVYAVDPQHPGSEVAAEIAAALAAASIAFRSSDPNYANVLLQRSRAVFEFADKYQGSYNDSLGKWVCPFYCDWSGYLDELIWGALWISKASNNSWYWNYVTSNIQRLGDYDNVEFGWDDKHAGIHVLIYKEDRRRAEKFACLVLPESPNRIVQYTRGGLLYKKVGSNMQNPAALSLLLVVLARYLNSANEVISCGNGTITSPSRLIEVAKSQVLGCRNLSMTQIIEELASVAFTADYILGKNPKGMSYMVGYGNEFPHRIHHRGSSMPSIDQYPRQITCLGGTPYLKTPAPNANLLTGAIVGGPAGGSDGYVDDRANFKESEPATYINAPMVGVFAYLSALDSDR